MSKFKVGERARFSDPSVPEYHGLECTIVEVGSPFHEGIPCDGCGSTNTDYLISPNGKYEIFTCECTLKKLLPDSDTYHPADISIDDLMRTIKTPETVI